MTEQQGDQQTGQPAGQQPMGGGELSQFERLSALTPKKTPFAILIGAALIPVVLWIINVLAPTEAVDELKEAEAERPAAASPAGGPDIDEI
jgi:hypothetical protein